MNLRDFLHSNIATGSTVNTDQFGMYRNLFYGWTKHHVVNHSVQEYYRMNKDGTEAHTNTAESFFSLVKRGVYGSWHHVSKEHLPKYASEFAFRWTRRKVSDGQRTVAAIQTTEGKRLFYRKTSQHLCMTPLRGNC